MRATTPPSFPLLVLFVLLERNKVTQIQEVPAGRVFSRVSLADTKRHKRNISSDGSGRGNMVVLLHLVGFLGSPLRDLRVSPFPAGVPPGPCVPALLQRRERPAPPAQYPPAIVATHFAQMSREAVIADIILESWLEQPCLIIKSKLSDVSDLGRGVAVEGLGFDLDLARVTITDRSVWLHWIGTHQGTGLQKLAPPRLKGREAVISLPHQSLRLRHHADVEIREIDLIQQVEEQRLISTIVEFCLQTGKVYEVLFARGRYGRYQETVAQSR